MSERDWVAWHAPYELPGSSLSRRLEIVQRRIRDVLDAAPPGPIRIVSVCAGQCRDVIGVLPEHPRRSDVRARLVELDAGNVEFARATAADAGLTGIEIVEADASRTDAYVGAVPADLVLVCGVFGNITAADIDHTVRSLPMLSAPGATVIWTRHRRDPDVTPRIRAWFADAGFEEVAFDAGDDFLFGIGTARFTGAPQPLERGLQLFDFVGDGSAANI